MRCTVLSMRLLQFTTSPICCPSRSSILTGKYAHNHQTKNNSRSGGCYGRVWRETIEPAALPVWLSQAGYDTFFAGKYLNEYFSASIPPGWSQWFGLHGNSRYYNFTVTENGKVATYTNEYFTDYLVRGIIGVLIRTLISVMILIFSKLIHFNCRILKR